MSTSAKCYCCLRSEHLIYKCEKFLSLMPEKRYDIVKERKLCINCLSINHSFQKCNSRYSCRECGKRHHVLLHRSEHQSNADSQKPSGSKTNHSSIAEPDPKVPTQVITTANNSDTRSHVGATALTAIEAQNLPTNAQKIPKQVMIATALIWVRDNAGFRMPCRAVLDSASHAHFITEDFCSKLNVNRKPSFTSISGIGETKSNPRQCVALTVQSRLSNYQTELEFLILPRITNELPLQSFKFNDAMLPPNFELADPYFNKTGKIDMLIGAEIYHEIVTGARKEIIIGFPPFQESKFGYLVSGPIGTMDYA